MAVLVGSDVRNIIAADFYIESEDAHNNGSERTVLVAAVGTTPSMFVRDVRATARRHQKTPTAEAFHVITSFTREEFNPDDHEDHLRLMKITQEYVREAFPGHQAKIAIQRDGRSGLLHTHTLIGKVSQTDEAITFKRRDEVTRALKTEEVSRPAGSGFGSQMRDVFRMRAVHDEVLLRHGLDNRALMSQTKTQGVRRNLADEAKRDVGEYVWRDDLRARIDEAIEVAPDSFSDWSEYLAKQGVFVRERGKSAQGAGALSYSFVDEAGKQRVSRAGGRNGLGADYNREGVDTALAAQRTAQRQPVQVVQPSATPAAPVSAPVEPEPEPVTHSATVEPERPSAAISEVKPMVDTPEPANRVSEPPAAPEVVEVAPRFVSKFRRAKPAPKASVAAVELLRALPEFEEYAVPLIERGERIDDTRVPKGLGSKRLAGLKKFMHPDLFEQMEARATKLDKRSELFAEQKRLHEELNEKRTPLTYYDPKVMALDAKLDHVKSERAALGGEIAAGVYEPIERNTGPRIVGAEQGISQQRQTGFDREF